MEALARANQIRTRRAKEKQLLKSGSSSTIDLLLEPPEHIESMKVLDLLRAAPKIGPVKSKRILNNCRISATKTVGGLSQRQRAELCTWLRRP